MELPPWSRLLTFVMFWGRMTQTSPSLQGTNCIDIYCSHRPLLSISEGWHHPFLTLGAAETLGPWEERDPASCLQVWPLQIFKTWDWSNVCLAGSVSPSCRSALFWQGFNALIRSGKMLSAGPGLGTTRKIHSMDHADRQTLRQRVQRTI